jgi:hypothetical protein
VREASAGTQRRRADSEHGCGSGSVLGRGRGTASTGAEVVLGEEAALGITTRTARVRALADGGG